MSWIQTFTGKQFFPLDPSPSTIDIRDIAHSLALQCRFNGHATVFYSVAEHSLRVSDVLPVDQALWGLLHDAAEAYVGDVPRPVKGCLPTLVVHEERLLKVIAEVFGLGWPMPDAVREADDVLLATEARDLLGPPPAAWGLGATPLVEHIAPMGPEEAEGAFLARYEQLAARRGG